MLHFLLLVSRQGKVRLARWFSPLLLVLLRSTGNSVSSAESSALASAVVAGRKPPPCSNCSAQCARAICSCREGSCPVCTSTSTSNFTAVNSGVGVVAASTCTTTSPSSSDQQLLVLPPPVVAPSGCCAALSAAQRNTLLREAAALVLQRSPKMCNVLEWRADTRLVYKRYASLFFIACIDSDDNPLLTLEIIHYFVEILDKYFGNVCELDLIFNFHKAYYLLDEIVCAGEMQESSKKVVLRVMNAQDALMDESNERGGSKVS